MSEMSSSQLLEDWVNWIFPQPWGSDIGNDTTGSTAEQLNKDRNIWLLSGTWGNAGATPKPIVRNIRVRKGTSIFIVLASSHATPEELGKSSASDEQLISHAKAVHKLWDITDLRINDKSEATTEVTRVLTPYISDNSYYSALAKSGEVRMATVAKVFVLDSARLGKEGEEHKIELDAHSRAGDPALGEPNEPEYVEDVTYKITVQPPLSSGPEQSK